jgi:hypothetical protein
MNYKIHVTDFRLSSAAFLQSLWLSSTSRRFEDLVEKQSESRD